ncbi:MAG: N-acetyltransferase [Oscillospiraceae bacterium]|nr:N-acetyltransferase [Oscillospiraceae bacterium]
MIQIRQAQKEDYPRMKELWQLAFGDSSAFIDGFFNRVNGEELFLLLEADALCSMMTLIPHQIVTTDGQRWNSGYVYGLATRPEARGKGSASMLLRYADTQLSRRGCACITTVPASPELFPFFQASGYEPAFFQTEREFSAPSELPTARWEALPPEVYAEKRERFLQGMYSYGSCRGELAALQHWMSLLSGGNLYELTAESGSAIAAVELLSDGTALAKELLSDQDGSAACDLLAGAVRAPRYRARLVPADEAESQSFAFVKYYFDPLRRILKDSRPLYFGLGLD